MTRWLFWLIGGIVLGGIAHLGMILLLPRIAQDDAYARLVPVAPVNTMTTLAEPTAGHEMMPFLDPAIASAVCRYDLSNGPLHLSVKVSQAYTSVSFYTRRGVAYYTVNDKAAGRGAIDLSLMTEQQRADMPEDEDVTAADRLIVESPTETGLILVKALAPEPGLMDMARDSVATAQCKPLPPIAPPS